MTEPRFKKGDRVIAFPDTPDRTHGEIGAAYQHPDGGFHYNIKTDPDGEIYAVAEMYVRHEPAIDQLARVGEHG